ncbi:MAG: hypothetical protein WBG46_15160 [Nonlabens sp.]
MRSLLLLLILLSSCNEENKKVVIDQDDYRISDLELMTSQVTLNGKALKKSLEWNEYQNFVTSMENYDHSKASSKSLLQASADLVNEADSAFTKPSIVSRALVLQTKAGVLSSFLGYTVKTPEQHTTKYNEMIVAWDELKRTINIEVNENEQSRQELLEILSNEERIDAERERRDSIMRDSL